MVYEHWWNLPFGISYRIDLLGNNNTQDNLLAAPDSVLNELAINHLSGCWAFPIHVYVVFPIVCRPEHNEEEDIVYTIQNAHHFDRA